MTIRLYVTAHWRPAIATNAIGASNAAVNLTGIRFLREVNQAIDRASDDAGPERALSWSSHEYLNRGFERPAGSVYVMDRPLLYILIALAGTLLLFAAGVFPYPFGLIVLTLLALGRFLQIKGPA